LLQESHIDTDCCCHHTALDWNNLDANMSGDSLLALANDVYSNFTTCQRLWKVPYEQLDYQVCIVSE
jgi:hypothetical protein